MSIECDKCDKCGLCMQIKQIRLCVECGKQHDTGVENKSEGTFERIDKCIDCLMSKCYVRDLGDPHIFLNADGSITAMKQLMGELPIDNVTSPSRTVTD